LSAYAPPTPTLTRGGRRDEAGQALARLVAIDEPKPLAGSVTFHVSDDELVAPLDVTWDAES
jgi:hypothetical protein